MNAASKRIVKEYGEIQANPLHGMKVTVPDEANMHKWEIAMEGPEQSVYAGGLFKLTVTLPNDYPFKPPVIQFATKIYHPNVSNDGKGSMCLGMLRAEEWKPPNKIAAVLNMVRQLLVEPNPDDAVEAAIADQWKGNRKEFEKVAKNWVKQYASGK